MKKVVQLWLPVALTCVGLIIGAFVWASEQHTYISDKCSESVKQEEVRSDSKFITREKYIETQTLMQENQRSIKRVESKIDLLIDHLIRD